jgi:CheY-like chemotaxis protein
MATDACRILRSGVLLCIDDNEEMLECEKLLLESFGYSVLCASTGREGLELACRYSVDVVILDYSMPEMNGQEVAIEMRRLRPQAPIIMLSGAGDVTEQALKWVNAIIVKNRMASHLLPAIAQLHGSNRAFGWHTSSRFLKTAVPAGLQNTVNNGKTAKQRQVSDQKDRQPQHGDPQKPAPPDQGPIIQPNQAVKRKPWPDRTVQKSAVGTKENQEQKKHA